MRPSALRMASCWPPRSDGSRRARSRAKPRRFHRPYRMPAHDHEHSRTQKRTRPYADTIRTGARSANRTSIQNARANPWQRSRPEAGPAGRAHWRRWQATPSGHSPASASSDQAARFSSERCGTGPKRRAHHGDPRAVIVRGPNRSAHHRFARIATWRRAIAMTFQPPCSRPLDLGPSPQLARAVLRLATSGGVARLARDVIIRFARTDLPLLEARGLGLMPCADGASTAGNDR